MGKRISLQGWVSGGEDCRKWISALRKKRYEKIATIAFAIPNSTLLSFQCLSPLNSLYINSAKLYQFTHNYGMGWRESYLCLSKYITFLRHLLKTYLMNPTSPCEYWMNYFAWIGFPASVRIPFFKKRILLKFKKQKR